jgi:hypothetical protein
LNIAVNSSDVARKPVYRIFGGVVDQKASILSPSIWPFESSAKYYPYAVQKTSYVFGSEASKASKASKST